MSNTLKLSSASSSSASIHPQGVDQLGSSGNSGTLSSISSNSSDHAAFTDDEDNDSNYNDTTIGNGIDYNSSRSTSNTTSKVRFTGGTEFNDGKRSAYDNDNKHGSGSSSMRRKRRPLPSSYNFTNDQMMARDDADGDNDDEDYFTANPLPLMSSNDALAMDTLRATVARQQQDQARHGSFKSTFSEQDEAEGRDADGGQSRSHSRSSQSHYSSSSSSSSAHSSPSRRVPKIRRPSGVGGIVGSSASSPHLSVLRGPILPASSGRSAFDNFDKDEEELASKTNNNNNTRVVKKIASEYNSVPLVMPRPEYLKAVNNYREYSSSSSGSGSSSNSSSDKESDSGDDHNPEKKDRTKKNNNKQIRKSVETEHALTVLLRHNPSHCPPFAVYSNLPEVSQAGAAMEKRLGPGYVSSYTFSTSSPASPSAFTTNASSSSSRNSPTSPQVSSNRGTWVRNFFIDVCFTKQTTVYTTDNAETRARKLKNVWVENEKRWPGYDYSRCVADALVFRNRSGLPLKLNADGSSQSSTSYAAASPSASVGIRKGGGGKGVDGREPLSGSVITNSRDSVLPLIALTYLYGMDEQVPLSMMKGAAYVSRAPTSPSVATDFGKAEAKATETNVLLASERGRDIFTYINGGERRDAALVCDGPSRGIGVFPNNRMCTTHLHEALVGSAGESTMPAVSVGGRGGGGGTKSSSSPGKTKSRHFVALRYLPSLCRAEDLLASDAGGDLFFRSSPTVKGRDNDSLLSPADQLEEARTFFGQFFRPQNETQLKKVLHPSAAKVLAAAPSSGAPPSTSDGADGVTNNTTAGSPPTSLPMTNAATGCEGNGATVQDPASHGVRSLASTHRLTGHPFYRMRQVLGYDVSCMLTSAVNLNSPDPTDDEELLLIECPSRSAKALLLAKIQRALVSFYAGMRRVHAKNAEQNPNPFSSVSAVFTSSALGQKGGHSSSQDRSRRRYGDERREGEGLLQAPRLRGDEEDSSEGDDERHAHDNNSTYHQHQTEGAKHPLHHADSRFAGAGYGVLDEDLCLDACLQRTFHMHAMRRLFFQCANKNRAALVNAAGALSKGLGLSITPPHLQQQTKQRQQQRASNNSPLMVVARPSIIQTMGPESQRSHTTKASSSLLPVSPSSPTSGGNNTNTTSNSKRTAIIDSFDASADDEVTILHKLLKSPPLKDSGVEGIFNYLMLRARTFVSLKKRRFTAESFNLDLAYVRPDMIAMGYPSVGKEALYRNPLQETMRFLETYHNLSGASYPVTLTSLILGLEIVNGTSSIPVGCPFDTSKETCPVLLSSSSSAARTAVTRRISLFGGGKTSNTTSPTTSIYGYGAVCKLAKGTAALAGLDHERDTVRSCAFMLPYSLITTTNKSTKGRQTPRHVDGTDGIASSPTASTSASFSIGGITLFGQKDRKKWEEEQTERVLETYSAVERFLYHDAIAVARSLCNNSVPSYRIYNLCSERCYPPSRFAGSFERFPADDHHPAPFNTLLAFCVSAGCFLAGGDGTIVPLFQLEKVLPPGMPSASAGHHENALHNMNGGTGTSLATNKNEGGAASGKIHKVSGAISSLLFSSRKHGQLQFMPVDPSLVDASALQRVVAIHCKAGKGRTGAMCVGLMLYLGQFERGWGSIEGREIDVVATSSPSPPRASSVGAGDSVASSKLGRSSPLFDRRIHPLFRALNWYGITRTHNNKGVSIASQLQFLEYLNWYLESERHRLARLFGNSQHPEDIALVRQYPKLACPVNFPIHYVPQLLRPPPCPTALLKSVSFSPYPCVDLDGKCKPYFIILCRGPNHTHYPLGQQEHVSVEADTLRPIYDSRLGWLSQKPHRRTELTAFGTSASSASGSPRGSKTSVRVVEKSSVSAMPPDATLASYQRDAELVGGDVSKLMAEQAAPYTPLLPPGVDPEATAYFPMRGFEITGEVRFVFYAEQRTNSLLFGTSSNNSTHSSTRGGNGGSSPTGEGATAAKSTPNSSKKKSGKSKDQYLFSFWIHTGFMQQQSRATRIEAYTPEGKFTHTTTDNKKSAKDDAATAASANPSSNRTAAGRGGSISGSNNTQHQHQLSRFSRFAHLADSVDCLDLHETARSGSGGVVRLRKEQLDGASKKNSKFFDSGFTCNIEFTLL